MRNIRFRQWIPQQNRMSYAGMSDGCWIGFEYVTWDKYPIMQFTGLKDKNGKEIWEGDIVNVAYLGEWKAIIEWDSIQPSFVLKRIGANYLNDTEYDFFKCGSMEIEVIGNIYSNPELLKGA